MSRFIGGGRTVAPPSQHTAHPVHVVRRRCAAVPFADAPDAPAGIRTRNREAKNSVMAGKAPDAAAAVSVEIRHSAKP
jgi:hypothetical protein